MVAVRPTRVLPMVVAQVPPGDPATALDDLRAELDNLTAEFPRRASLSIRNITPAGFTGTRTSAAAAMKPSLSR